MDRIGVISRQRPERALPLFLWPGRTGRGAVDPASFTRTIQSYELVNSEAEMTDKLESLPAPHDDLGVGWATKEKRDQCESPADADGAVREDVIAQVSHDLRVPLQAIAVTVDELKRPCLDEAKLDRKLALIERCTRRMTHLVEDLLDVALIRHGALVLCRESARMEDLLAEAVELLRVPAERKRIHVNYQPPETLILLRCDEDRVLRLLTNLIGNAIKFTPEGGRVVVRTWNSHGGVTVAISDTGPGIAEDDRALVFEPFRKGGHTQASGLGLGLHIARAIVEATLAASTSRA